MNEERIKELFSNEEFVKDLFASESFEAAKSKLATKDVEMSVDELKKAYELVQKKQAGELSDKELEDVAGGSAGIAFGIIVAIIVGGAAGGIAKNC